MGVLHRLSTLRAAGGLESYSPSSQPESVKDSAVYKTKLTPTDITMQNSTWILSLYEMGL